MFTLGKRYSLVRGRPLIVAAGSPPPSSWVSLPVVQFTVRFEVSSSSGHDSAFSRNHLGPMGDQPSLPFLRRSLLVLLSRAAVLFPL